MTTAFPDTAELVKRLRECPARCEQGGKIYFDSLEVADMIERLSADIATKDKQYIALNTYSDGVLAERERLSQRVHQQRQEITRLSAELVAKEAECQRWKEQSFRPLGDNHHNAAMCPHCNPKPELQRQLAEARVLLHRAIAGIKNPTHYSETVKDFLARTSPDDAQPTESEAAP